MYNREIKIALSVLSLAISVLFFYYRFYFLGVLFILILGLIILSIFRNENILAAFYYLRKNNVPKAQQFLDRVKHPEKLIKSQQAYFNYLNGLVSTQSQSLGKAETYFKKALNIGLNMKADQAMAKLNLAGIYMSKRNKRVAQHFLKEAKVLDDKKLLSDQIKEMEKHMKRI